MTDIDVERRGHVWFVDGSQFHVDKPIDQFEKHLADAEAAVARFGADDEARPRWEYAAAKYRRIVEVKRAEEAAAAGPGPEFFTPDDLLTLTKLLLFYDYGIKEATTSEEHQLIAAYRACRAVTIDIIGFIGNTAGTSEGGDADS